MNIMNWIHKAKSLPINGHTRTQCCNKNNTAIISHGKQWYRIHCFRCGLTEVRPTNRVYTLDELAEIQKVQEFKESASLPADATDTRSEFSHDARVWLAQAGILNPSKYGIHFSNHLNRVLLPVHNQWALLHPTGYQARSILSKPKYISTGNAECHCIMTNNSDDVCIVEDILSAIRISTFTSTLALIGTYLTDKAIRNLVTLQPHRVIVWLDPDEAGKAAASKVVSRLTTLGIGQEIRNILARDDPKRLPDTEIGYCLYASRT